MNRVAIVGCFTTLLLVGGKPTTRPTAISSDEIGNGVTIVGRLGLPVGQETTISGRKDTSYAPGSGWFLVDKIDGKAATGRLHVSVPGIRKWKNGTEATLRGAEVGTLHFSTNTNYGPNDPRWKGPRQELFLEFDAQEVIEPKGLAIVR